MPHDSHSSCFKTFSRTTYYQGVHAFFFVMNRLMKWKWEKLAVTQLPNRLGKKLERNYILSWYNSTHSPNMSHWTASVEYAKMWRRACFLPWWNHVVQHIFIFKTANVWNHTICLDVANHGGNSFHQSSPPHKDSACVVTYDGPVGRSPRRPATSSSLPQLILITINSLNQNLRLTSIPISDR